jgi:Tol biopolymer transport system component
MRGFVALLLAVGVFCVLGTRADAMGRQPALQMLGPAVAGAGFSMLYTSNWEGRTQFFAADPSGREPVGQLSFVPPFTCDSRQFGSCVFDPLPSPDGRNLLFYSGQVGYSAYGVVDYYTLWVERLDGGGPRLISSGTFDSVDGRGPEEGLAAWSPDSRHFAYLDRCCLFGSTPGAELHVVSADGSNDRIVNSSPSLAQTAAIAWTKDSHRVRAAPPAPGPSGGVLLSPNGKWKANFWQPAYAAAKRLVIESLRGSRPLAVLDAAPWGVDPAWSPDSRLLAYVAPDGIRVLDLGTRKTRLLSHDPSTYLKWAPDGSLLGYIHGSRTSGGIGGPGDLRTVTLHGHVRIVVSAGEPYGGLVWSFAWMRRPNGLHYPAPPAVGGIYTGQAVTALAADGDRVAYITCAGVFLWAPPDAAATQIAKPQITDEPCSNFEEMPSVALAGDRVVYVDEYGGNTSNWSARGVSLGPTPGSVVLVSGAETCCLAEMEAAGSGGLLVFSSRALVANSRNVEWVIRSAGATGCPCQEIARFVQPLEVSSPIDDVDAGRIVIDRPDAVRILDSSGEQLLAVPPSAEVQCEATFRHCPSFAALSGNDLVVDAGAEFRDYDASTGALLHSWQPVTSREGRLEHVLQDTAHGLVAYTVNGEVHLLRLTDGADAVITAGSLARFDDAGLVYATGARIEIVPYDQLPLH